MQNEHELIILNCPRFQKRGLTINRNGRITLRSKPCQQLGLVPKDKICFGIIDFQMYIIKCATIPDAIILSGRKGQLHGSSVNTVRHLFKYILGISQNTKEVDLVVANDVSTVTISGIDYKALPIVNRADPNHCR